jgi:hypothetical protein
MSIEELAQKIYETEYIGVGIENGPTTTEVSLNDLKKIDGDVFNVLCKIENKFWKLLENKNIIDSGYKMYLAINTCRDIIICYYL